jgi:hypothetical protein
MSSIASTAAVDTFAPVRPPRWLAAKPETRIGIDFTDNGFTLTAIRLLAQCASLDARELRVEMLHQVTETAPSPLADIGNYLNKVESRLPRFATRGGAAASIAMPPSLQSLRCVSTAQLNDAERAIAEELGGEVQCRSWAVNSQRSMICGVRRDVAEYLIGMLHNAGYRCESILPRSVALARTQLATATPRIQNAIILCWDRNHCLVTVVHQRSLKLCREFTTSSDLDRDAKESVDESDDSAQVRLARRANEVAVETMLSLQHAMRLDNRIVPDSVIVCGEMSTIDEAMSTLQSIMSHAYGIQVTPWTIATTGSRLQASQSEDLQTSAVAIALAVGSSRSAIETSLPTGKSR